MKRLVFFLISVFFLLFSASVQAKIEADGLVSPYKVIIDDEIDLLTDDEEALLIDDMMPITKYGTAVFRTFSERGLSSEHDMALEYLTANVAAERSFPCVSFHINMATRQLWILSRGNLEKKINTQSGYTISGNVSWKATSQKYYACASMAFSQILSVIEENRVISVMSIFCSILLAAALSLIAALRIVYGKWKPGVPEMVLPLVGSAVSVKVLSEELTYSHSEKKYQGDYSSDGGYGGGGGGGGGGSSCGSGGGSGF